MRYGCSSFRSIDYGCGKVAFLGSRTGVEHLAGNHFDTASWGAVTTGHTGHADAVVVYGGYRTGHVCTMAVGIDFSLVGAEVPAIYVVDISVAVVVDTRCAVKFGIVDAHVGGKVFVGVVHTAVDDCHNHIFPACCGFPGLEQVDVGTGHTVGYVAEILIVPLLWQERVVERHVCCRFRRDCGPVEFAESVAAFLERHRGDYFGVFHTGGGSKDFASLVG